MEYGCRFRVHKSKYPTVDGFLTFKGTVLVGIILAHPAEIGQSYLVASADVPQSTAYFSCQRSGVSLGIPPTTASVPVSTIHAVQPKCPPEIANLMDRSKVFSTEEALADTTCLPLL